MILTLVGAIVLGIAVGGTLLLVINFLRLPLPGWIVPLAAGTAMIGFAIYLDYTWFGRLAAALSPRSVIAATYADTSPLKPWTYLAPPVNRFVVVDAGSILPVAGTAAVVQAIVIGVARWQPTWTRAMLFDCQTPRRADLGGAPVVDGSGEVVGIDWVPVDAGDDLWRAVCAGRRSPNGQD